MSEICSFNRNMLFQSWIGYGIRFPQKNQKTIRISWLSRIYNKICKYLPRILYVGEIYSEYICVCVCACILFFYREMLIKDSLLLLYNSPYSYQGWKADSSWCLSLQLSLWLGGLIFVFFFPAETTTVFQLLQQHLHSSSLLLWFPFATQQPTCHVTFLVEIF